MIQLTYETPEILNEVNKPTAYANESFPYNGLPSPRRFEELIYTLVRRQLGGGNFKLFDKVSLMSGVAEQGRDCALFTAGRSTGVIQCKKYLNNLSKEEFGREITKFVLYSLLEKKLIHKPADFTYYIAVSKGLTGECSDFIDAFTSEVPTEPLLVEWISYNLNKYITLAPLKIDRSDTLNNVIAVLSEITVIPIRPADLDLYMEAAKNDGVIQLFFEVKTVTDNFEIRKLREEIKASYISELNGDTLTKQLSWGSHSLKAETNFIPDIPNSHIERSETTKLYNWITAGAKKDKFGNHLNFCLLAGNAGMGKTVILKDLYDRLAEGDIAVLGLKADKLASSTVGELQAKIGLSVPLYEFIDNCKKNFGLTVLVIDQIDALSQSMSSDRSYLQVFKDFINQYLHDQKVRIIVSVRIFDLHFDPSLRPYKDIESIIVDRLSEHQVFEQLTKLSIEQQSIPGKLLELLRTPNHLSVFARVYIKNKKALGILSLQELYQELWRQKITHMPRKNSEFKQRTKQVLFLIAQKMFADQHIYVSELQFENFSDELLYLESEQLLKKEDRQMQFFHQSFYDFVFAKQFIENGQSLAAYITENSHSLQIRSAVKMMLHYQRDYDPLSYMKTLESIFFDQSIAYHIKHMALSTLFFHALPTGTEKELVWKLVNSSFHLCIHFFQQAVSPEWFAFALEKKMLRAIENPDSMSLKFDHIDPREYDSLKNACFFFLRHAAGADYVGAWEIVTTLKDKSIVGNILFVYQNWVNPLAYTALKAYTEFEEIDPFGYYHALNNIARTNPDYSLSLIATSIRAHHKKGKNDRDYQEREVLQTLAKKCPDKLFPLILEAILDDFNQIHNEKKLIGDYHFMRVDLKDKDTLTGSDYLYRLAGVCLKRCAAAKKETFIGFFDHHLHTRYKPLLRLFIFAMSGAEVIFADQIFKLFNYLYDCEEVRFDSLLAVEMRISFQSAFPAFSTTQKTEVTGKIASMTHPEEIIHYNKQRASLERVYTSKGLSKLTWLRKLPVETVKKDHDLWREFNALQRRFVGFKEQLPSGNVMAGMVGTPLKASAYKFMSHDQWLKSFKRYDGTKKNYNEHFLKGNIEEHCNAFKAAVKDQPTFQKLELIKSAWADPDIKPNYPIYGLWGWSESNAENTEIEPIFKEIIGAVSEPEHIRNCLYIAKNIVSAETVDKAIIQYLCQAALDFKDEDPFFEDGQTETKETSTGGLITRGINTMDGSAAESLVHVQDHRHIDLVFSTLETVLSKGPKASRASVLFQFAHLMRADSNRAFDMFCRALENETDIYVTASAIWSIQYLRNHDFKRLRPILKKLVETKILGQDDAHWLFTILYGSYLHGEPGAEELLLELVVSSKFACRAAINDIIENYYLIEGTKSKNDALLDFVLEKSTEEDYESLGWNFAASTHIELKDITVFLKKYISSKYFKINHQLAEYLCYQCGKYPFEAIELFELAIESNKFDKGNRQGIYSNEMGTKFIINAANSLINNDHQSIALRQKLMLAFDKVLMDYRFSADTDRLLEELV